MWARASARPIVVSATPRQLYLQRLGDGSFHRTYTVAAPLAHAVTPDMLCDALTAVVASHDALRVRIRVQGTARFQEVTDNVEVTVTRSAVAEGELAAHLRKLADTQIPFTEPPLRCVLVEPAQGPRILCLSVACSLADLAALEVLLDDLRAALAGLPLPIPETGWAEFSREAAEHHLFADERQERRAYAGPPMTSRVLAVPEAGGEMEELTFLLPRDVLAGLEHHWNLQVILTGLLAVVLARSGSHDEVATGVAVSNRDHPGWRRLVGSVEAVVPVAVSLRPGTTFSDVLTEVESQLNSPDCGEESDLDSPGVEETRLARRCTSLVRVLEHTCRLADDSPVGAARRVTAAPWPYDFVLDIGSEPRADLTGTLAYAPDRYSGSYAALLRDRLKVLAEAACRAPDGLVSDLPIMTADEADLLRTFAGADGKPADLRRLHEIILDRADREPHRTAVLDATGSLTYGALATRARHIAGRLRRRGAGPDVVVGICASRSTDLVAGMLGILEAGAAYLPLDPSVPAERTGRLLTSTRTVVVLADPAGLAALAQSSAGTVVLDLEALPLAATSSYPVEPTPRPGQTDLAYVIFTSGSTGQPKAVGVPHCGIVNRLVWMQDRYRLTPEDVVLQKTPITFDVSVWELFWPLMVGAALVMEAPGAHRDPEAMAATIRRHGVTVVHFVPSMLAFFIEELAISECPTLRHVICSGEALPVDTVNQFCRLSDAEIHNLYGPTEASVDVTHWTCERVEPGPTVPIGRPIANTITVVLDPLGRPTPLGAPGELHLGGAGLARGYLGRPDLTAERFVSDPTGLTTAGRLYRTGDLARWLPSGALEYLGRNDHQIKFHGVRIEPREIEVALKADPAVAESVVVLRSDVGVTPTLVGYVVGHSGTEPDPAALRTGMTKLLPAALIPSVVVVLDRLPINANGKLDRSALPLP